MNYKIEILHEDENLLVVNKPAGLVVNNSKTARKTLQEIIASRINTKGCDQNSEFVLRNGIVHRIDKDTSGVLLIAKNEETFGKFLKAFKERKVQKEYLAVVRGEIIDDKIVVNAPLHRNPRNRQKIAVVAGGRESVTEIEKTGAAVIENIPVTLAVVRPQSGRTHQIRVHLAAINHPVLGDSKYGGKHFFDPFKRLMLHAWKISFENFSFTAPIPAEFSLTNVRIV